MKIGGEFEFVQYEERVNDNLESYLVNKFSNLQYFTSGRSGIFTLFEYLLNKKQIVSNIYLPAYLCESIYFPVLKALNKKSIKIFFYPQNEQLESYLDIILNNSIVYLIDYFGKTDHLVLEKMSKMRLKNLNIILVRDITHSLFNYSPNDEVDYYVCSLRKWTFLPDGAIIASNIHELPKPKGTVNENFIQARLIASKIKLLNISYEVNVFKDEYYLNIFQFCERELDKYIDSIAISDNSVDLLKKINYKSLIKKREQNRKYLLSNISGFKQFLIINDSSLYTIPVMFKNTDERNSFRSKMKSFNIFLPLHWPVEWQKELQGNNEDLYKRNKEISDRLLSFVIDQRYGKPEMKYVVDVVREVLEEKS